MVDAEGDHSSEVRRVNAEINKALALATFPYRPSTPTEP